MEDKAAEASKDQRVAALIRRTGFDEARYQYNDRFQPWDGKDPFEAHTTMEMVRALEANQKIGFEGRYLQFHRESGKFLRRKVSRKGLMESFKPKRGQIRESFFGSDDSAGVNQGLVGDDFVPLLGGPFYKQLYIYDYLRMMALSFHAYHHDPVARGIVHITRDFTLGRGYRVDFPDDDGGKMLTKWRMFEAANDFQEKMRLISLELSVNGEIMLWWLPNNESRVTYQLGPNQKAPTAIIPRVRMIDPSVIWEIVTYPEDITRVLFYQWIAPTQYQMYTGRDQGNTVPSLKFIFQQIPGTEVDHYKINCFSNEKRGRSDLFPILGYLKRLRDAVNYGMVAMQKQAAWSEDVTIQGSQADIDNFKAQMDALGEFAPAGSQFVHTNAITREFLSNQTGRQGQQEIFQWNLSMACMGAGIPFNYLGTHLASGTTRAGSVVATEPVAKKFEMRQLVYENILRGCIRRVCGEAAAQAAEITFPEIITQDRSAKLKDLALAQAEGWISRERAATTAAKELDFTSYEYETEFENEPQPPEPTLGASAGGAPMGGTGVSGAAPSPLTTLGKLAPKSNGGISGTERKNIKDQNSV